MSTDNELIERLNNLADVEHALILREAADRLAQLTTERDNVLALHRKGVTREGWTYCVHCESPGRIQVWPCPTVRAMGVTE